MYTIDNQYSAAALYEGGWRAGDAHEIAEEYGLDYDEAYRLCAELADIEANDADDEYSVEVKAVVGENTNANYDPDRANNGGGYWQPQGRALVRVGGKEMIVIYSDDSCGDFGRDETAAIKVGMWRYQVLYNVTMEDRIDTTMSVDEDIARIWRECKISPRMVKAVLDAAIPAIREAASAAWDADKFAPPCPDDMTTVILDGGYTLRDASGNAILMLKDDVERYNMLGLL